MCTGSLQPTDTEMGGGQQPAMLGAAQPQRLRMGPHTYTDCGD